MASRARQVAHTGASRRAGIVGRDDMIRALHAAATDALDGRGSLILLTGEAGIGKTTLVRALASELGPPTSITWGRCTADGSAPPFWPWRELVDTASRQDGASEERSRFEMLNELRNEVCRRASMAPILHVIEDVQWADVASMLLLAHLSSGLDGHALLVIATLRTGEAIEPALEAAMEDVRREAIVHEVPPLSVDDVARLVAGAGISDDPALPAAIHARTRGNALFATELIRAVALERRADATLDDVVTRVPGRVSDLIARRQSRLPAAVADVVATASVLGGEGNLSTLAAAHGITNEAVLTLVDQAQAAHLLDVAAGRWQFRHEIVRDAVYDRIPVLDRPGRHVDALEALAEEASSPPAVLAAHAQAALPVIDADRAAALAARAGEAAFAQHAYEEAIGWFDRALEAAPASTSARWRAEVLSQAAEAHRRLGATEDARQAFRTVVELVNDPALVARAALGFANPGADLGIAFRSDDPAIAELLVRAISLQPPGDTPTAVALEARLASELYFSDDPARAATLSASAVARARRLGDPAGLVAALAVHHDAFVVGQRDLGEQLATSETILRFAHQEGAAASLLTAHRARLFALLSAGDVAAVEREIVAFRRISDPLRIPAFDWWPAIWAAMRALLGGRHQEAEALGLEAYRIGERPFVRLAILNLSFLLFFLRREQGRLAEMEQATREYAASYADVPALRVGLIFLLSELGHADEARSLLATVDDDALDRLHDRNWPASWFQLCRAAFLTGDAGAARRLIDRTPSERCVMVSLATVCLGSTALAAAWAHHIGGDLERADAAYREAEEANSKLGARSWLAQAQVDHARLLVDRGAPGDREEATRLAAVAAAAAETIGLAPVLHAVAPLAAVAAPVPQRRMADRSAAFRRTGGVWELRYSGRTSRVSHVRGLSDVAHLLARPHQEISAAELAGIVIGARGAAALDDRARDEIRSRLRDLDDGIDEADSNGDEARASLLREERQALAEAVVKDLGLMGRSRLIDDDGERARKTVSMRIRRAIAHIEPAHPDLARHLDRSIDTGAWCAYRPAEDVSWST